MIIDLLNPPHTPPLPREVVRGIWRTLLDHPQRRAVIRTALRAGTGVAPFLARGRAPIRRPFPEPPRAC